MEATELALETLAPSGAVSSYRLSRHSDSAPSRQREGPDPT
jgi:hypothetical protein